MHGRALRVGGAEPWLTPQWDGEWLVHSLGKGIQLGWQGQEDSSWLPVGQVGSGVSRAASLHHVKHPTSTLLPVALAPWSSLSCPSMPHGLALHWPRPVTESTKNMPPALPEAPTETPQDFGGGRAVPAGAGQGFTGGEQGWGCRRPGGGAELRRCGRYVCGRQAGWGRRRERKRQRQQLL